MVRLRRFTPADLDALHAIYGDAEVMRWVEGEWGPREATAAALRSHIASGEWQAVLDEHGSLIGEVGLEPRGDELEIGWTFTRAAWGRGYATQAAAALLSSAPADATVVALIHPENTRSVRVAERLGLAPAGRCGNRLRYARGANVRPPTL